MATAGVAPIPPAMDTVAVIRNGRHIGDLSMADTRAARKAFLDTYQGGFTGILRWQQLDALWSRVQEIGNWYIYRVGRAVPTEVVGPEDLATFLRETSHYLRVRHRENYCGIVYADDTQWPSLIKIYDPQDLGVVCGVGSHTTLPGWILSTAPPVDVIHAARRTAEATHSAWWRRLIGD